MVLRIRTTTATWSARMLLQPQTERAVRGGRWPHNSLGAKRAMELVRLRPRPSLKKRVRQFDLKQRGGAWAAVPGTARCATSAGTRPRRDDARGRAESCGAPCCAVPSPQSVVNIRTQKTQFTCAPNTRAASRVAFHPPTHGAGARRHARVAAPGKKNEKYSSRQKNNL